LKRRQKYAENPDKVKTRQKNYNNTHWYVAIATRCKKISREKKLDYDIDSEYLKELYEKDKRCHYCRLEMKSVIGNTEFAQISVCRLDNTIGHTKNNIVLVCIFCTYAKNCSNDNDFRDYINLLQDESYKFIHKYKQDNGYGYKILKSLKEYMKRDKITCDLKPDDIRNIYHKQDGKSALTGIKMIPSECPNYPFKPSIDRICNDKPHTFDNLHLVCQAENHGRSDKSIDEFKEYIQKIKDNFKKMKCEENNINANINSNTIKLKIKKNIDQNLMSNNNIS
jgi:hypothetical protein